MKKYQLLEDDTIIVDGVTLQRIRYLRDFADVKAGDLGGYLESDDNLSHEGDARVLETACGFGHSSVSGNALVAGNAYVFGEASVRQNAKVFGNACVSDWSDVAGNARVYDNAHIADGASVDDYAMVYGDAVVSGDAQVYGYSHVFGNSRCFILSPMNINGLLWNTTLTDNNIHFGKKTLTFEEGLVFNWESLVSSKEQSQRLLDEKTLIVEAIKLRLKRLDSVTSDHDYRHV